MPDHRRRNIDGSGMSDTSQAHMPSLILCQTEHNTIRAYELVLNPGAPGGAGYGTEVSCEFLVFIALS